jgi:hypothetical protein
MRNHGLGTRLGLGTDIIIEALLGTAAKGQYPVSGDAEKIFTLSAKAASVLS